jgi:hypothetical protein
MARTISYSAAKGPIRILGVQVAPGGGRAKTPTDGYTERLAKYIPAETLAFFVPLATYIGADHPTWLWIVVGVGIVGTPLYLWLNSQTQPATSRPLPHYYILVMVAFVIWALGVDPNFSKMVGLPQFAVTVVMGLAVYILPAIDALFAAWGF